MTRVKEQSHKDEMRAALLGDFSRMRARREPVEEAVSSVPRPRDAPVGSSRGSP